MGKNEIGMMKRIDIFGVPGTGKTTIYKNLRRKKKAGSWHTADETLKNIYRSHFKKVKYTLQDILFLIASLLHPAKGLIPKDEDKYRDFIKNNITSKNNLIEYYLENIGRDKKTLPYIKAKRVEFLLSALEDLVILEKFCKGQIILFDESVTNRLFQFIFVESSKTTENLFHEFDKFPLPDGYVLLDAPENVILDRLKSRDRVTLYHRGLSEQEVLNDITVNTKKYRMARDSMTKRGVSGIVVDTSNSLNQCIFQIEKYLNSF